MDSLDEQLSTDDARKIYSKISRLIVKELTHHGFKKYTSTGSAQRMLDDVWQLVFFQKSRYGQRFRLTLCIEPTFPIGGGAHFTIGANGILIPNWDHWFRFNNDYSTVVEQIISILRSNVISFADKMQFPKDIVAHKSEFGVIGGDDALMVSALWVGEYEIAKDLLMYKIASDETWDESDAPDYLLERLKLHRQLLSWIDSNDRDSIQNCLKDVRDKFPAKRNLTV